MINKDYMMDENGNLIESLLDITQRKFQPRPEPVLNPPSVQPMPTQPEQPQQSGGLLSAFGGGDFDWRGALSKLGAAHLALSQDPALQAIGTKRLNEMKKLKASSQMKNRTIKALRDAKRYDLADAVESGLLGATDAAKILFAKPDVYKAASPVGKLAADLRAGVINEEQYTKGIEDLTKSGLIINTGNQVSPAKAESGTQVIKEGDIYTQVPMYGSDAANQVQTAIQTAQNTLDVIDQTMADEEGLAAAVGPLDARAPTFGESATRFESYHNQLKGKAFLAAFESLKGGGQITEIEGQKAEQAISRLNLAMSEKDYKEALQDLRQVVEQGLQRAKEQWGRIPKPESATSSNDPLGIR